MDQLPKKITPSPLYYVMAELRFDTVENANTGNILQDITVHFQNQNKRIMPLNAQKFGIHVWKFAIQDGKNQILFGSDIVTFRYPVADGYEGWEHFLAYIESNLGIFYQTMAFQNLNLVGMRYVNVFENEKYISEVCEKVTINSIPNFKNVVQKHELYFQKENFIAKVLLTDESDVQMGTQKTKEGVIIDITASNIKNLSKSIESWIGSFNEVHSGLKELFFSLIKTEYLNTKLNPEYFSFK